MGFASDFAVCGGRLEYTCWGHSVSSSVSEHLVLSCTDYVSVIKVNSSI